MKNIIEQSERLLVKFPNHIPVYIEREKNSSVDDIPNKKFLVKYETKIGDFCYLLRKRIKLKECNSLFLLINDRIVCPNDTFGKIYEKEKMIKNFLHITYFSESTFG